MNSADYRKQLLDDIQQDDEQLDSCSQEFIDLSGDDGKIKSLIDALTNTATPTKAKLAAMQDLNVVSNFSPVLSTRMPDYVNAMRGLLDDPDPEVKQQAFLSLTAMKDEIAQQKLLDELQSPKTESEKIVPTYKAIAMLGMDEKALNSQLLQFIAQNPPDDASLIEAVRHIPADKDSMPILVSIMEDESKPTNARTIVSNMINSYDPLIFLDTAQKMVENKTATLNLEVARNIVEGVSELATTQVEAERQGVKKLRKALAERPELMNDASLNKAISKIDTA